MKGNIHLQKQKEKHKNILKQIIENRKEKQNKSYNLFDLSPWLSHLILSAIQHTFCSKHRFGSL